VFLDSSNPEDMKCMPGPLYGTTLTNEDGVLESFNMVYLDFSDMEGN